MKKTILVIGLAILACVVSLLGVYQILLQLQVRNVRALGWEGDHYLWTVGMFGNVRWDVNQQTVVNHNFQPDAIDQIFTSQEGEIWGYGYGVWRFKSGQWIEVDETAGLQPAVIYDMIQINDGTIWVATSYGFKTWDKKTQQWKGTAVDEPGQTLVQTSNSTLWFGLIKDGVIRLQSGKLTHWTTSNGLTDNRIRSILPASDGTVWIGTSRGINYWNGSSWQGWESLGSPDPEGLTVYKLLETSDGAIWADTSQGFARWKQGQWTTYERSPFCGNSYAFLETDSGSLWAGCATGIFRWTGSNWHEYGVSEGILDNSFGRLIQGTNGILYASTKSGIYQYSPDHDHWQTFPNK